MLNNNEYLNFRMDDQKSMTVTYSNDGQERSQIHFISIFLRIIFDAFFYF